MFHKKSSLEVTRMATKSCWETIQWFEKARSFYAKDFYQDININQKTT